MGFVTRLKCEKKLVSADEKWYETENDSSGCTGSSGSDDPAQNQRQISKRRTKHRWFHTFKANNDIHVDVDERRHSSLALMSANHFAEILDTRGDVLDRVKKDLCKRTLAKNCGEDSTLASLRTLPSGYWKTKILPKFTSDQRDILVETMFSHIWRTQGETIASKLLQSHESQSLSNIANDHFNNGCQLWAENNNEGARAEFERSKRIREVQSAHKSLLHIKGGQDRYNNMTQVPEDDVEANAELFFALGMVQAAENNNYAALREFRRAMQISGHSLGIDYDLTKASIYMIRSVLQDLGRNQKQINHTINQLMVNINNEIEGDQLYEQGEKEQALVEYANLSFLYDTDSMVQSRIITKMATIFEEKRDFSKAMDLWTDLLVLYEDTPSIGIDHPLARHALTKVVEARRQLQPWCEF